MPFDCIFIFWPRQGAPSPSAVPLDAELNPLRPVPSVSALHPISNKGFARALPLLICFYDLMNLSKTIKPPLVEASQTDCWSPPALPEQLLQVGKGSSTQGLAPSARADPLPGNAAAARPQAAGSVTGARATLPTLGCTGHRAAPPPRSPLARDQRCKYKVNANKH